MQIGPGYIETILQAITIIVNKYKWGNHESCQSVAQPSPVQSSAHLRPGIHPMFVSQNINMFCIIC